MDTPMKRLPFIFALAAGTASSAVALAQNEPTVTVTACDGKPCAEAKYCKRVSCESPGVCAPRPKACNDIYLPVCGCDQKTYGNACDAASRGVSVAHDGTCEKPEPVGAPPPVEAKGPRCGARGAPACAEGMYCALGADCGASDPTGVCRPLEKECDAIYRPVCGCDQKTYGNACEAASKGVSVAQQGACK